MAEAKAEETKQVTQEVDATKTRIAQLEQENASLLKETLAKKELIRDLETKKQAEEQERLKEQNKYKELYEGTLPKSKRLEELEPVFTTLLEAEIGDIPEDKRDLIPNFDKPEQKLLWVRNAKSKGLFGSQKQEVKLPGTVQSKVNTDQTLPEFLSWSANDNRLTTLSISDFQKWKQHNQKTSSGVRGWGTHK